MNINFSFLCSEVEGGKGLRRGGNTLTQPPCRNWTSTGLIDVQNTGLLPETVVTHKKVPKHTESAKLQNGLFLCGRLMTGKYGLGG